MKNLIALVTLVSLLSPMAQAIDVTMSPTRTAIFAGGATLLSTLCALPNESCTLRMVEARQDALAFVASDGKVRGAQLESALQYYRSQNPHVRASDMDIATLIAAN